MASIKETKDEALAIINAAQTILNNYPDLDITDISLSSNVSVNPFPFLMDILKNTQGYDYVINLLSQYIATALPPLEIAIKGVLLSNVKNLISCSINPFISEELLRNGITFDLKQIDITNLLTTCPLDSKIGKYYYFGCDDMLYVDETKNSTDFNAFLWYMKNRALTREVWGKTSNENNYVKQKKADGIITVEYNENAASLTDAVGSPLYTQTPYNNVLHVFLGNTKTYDTRVNDLDNKFKGYSEQIISLKEEIEEYKEKLEELEDKWTKIQKKYESQDIDKDEYLSKQEEYTKEKDSYETIIEECESELEGIEQSKQEAVTEYRKSVEDTPLQYRPVEYNYYYKKTLIQFNYDYIMSLRLFDSKVVTAQLLDALTGMLSIDLNLSYSQQLIQSETRKIVENVVETDDTTVSDCFFTFSNDDYNSMLEKTEGLRSGLYTMSDNTTSDVTINAEELLSTLNGISDTATKQEVQTIIEGSLTEISGMLSSTSYNTNNNVNIGIQFNFIEKLLNNLAYVIVMSVISPKVYLLLLINLKTLGERTDFSLNDFLSAFRQLMTEIIRAIRDDLIQFIVNAIMTFLATLAQDVATKIAIEQAAYYAKLIKRLVESFKNNSNTLDWQVDSVNYADITEETTAPETTEC